MHLLLLKIMKCVKNNTFIIVLNRNIYLHRLYYLVFKAFSDSDTALSGTFASMTMICVSRQSCFGAVARRETDSI